ncbi:hypothetical protein GCM10010168_62450 [Actinoplanes ianthinogenes]|uniref:Multidrug efflux pump subunit AcrA (Membrane-fusion protein) n=1 Tax=Actinoplanes ianthinogenes TaxID=122358 RepID=A0ABM7LJR5_9ACTN|nr:HlyD family efflux transporter periplasmic adaptor subunit [Actinoplanes ianthinogenes]BCJ39507.1 hypothetical protein Aiant_01640 [Actinoplanes ianthinogenes]GGR35610.1 hypothetical protein GCM10010168_62450 [Actinoplanes ianthinogenes]
MSRRGVALAIVVTAPLAAGVAYAAQAEPHAAQAPAAEITTGTAEVTRGRLTQTVQVGGELSYTGSYTIDHQGEAGVLTASAAPGATIGRGRILFRVADHPVRLLLGAVPAYRDFRYGMSDGPDVRQLETNLVALGLDPDHRMTVDRHFSAATAAAIRRWEASWGRRWWERTGTLTQGDVVFLPTPVRVTTRSARIGAPVGPGTTVLTGTSTERAVIAQVQTDSLSRVHVGDRVSVELPDADPIPGRVTEIGQAATLPANSPDADPQNPDAATVPVTVAVRLPRGLAVSETPVTVDVTTGAKEHVLLAPIAALLARPGGGYQVRLAGGTLVPVQLGDFDESSGRVEVKSGLTEGQSVEVPA